MPVRHIMHFLCTELKYKTQRLEGKAAAKLHVKGAWVRQGIRRNESQAKPAAKPSCKAAALEGTTPSEGQRAQELPATYFVKGASLPAQTADIIIKLI